MASRIDLSGIGPQNEMQELRTKHQQSPSQADSDEIEPANGSIIFGFDSAWAGKSPGAIGAIRIGRDGRRTFCKPILVSFEEAFDYIRERKKGFAYSLAAIDQPTIVRNKTGSRPVDRVASSLMGYIGGGTQPANLGKADLFGEQSLFMRFLSKLGAVEDPLLARAVEEGEFMIEVYPALALPSLHSPFAERLGAPKYNPSNKNFRHEDWIAVTGVVARLARRHEIEGLEAWAKELGEKKHKTKKSAKEDQDRLDAAICALVGYFWRFRPQSVKMAMIGDLDSGYMITPISGDTRDRLEKAAQKPKNGVPFCVPD